MAFVPASNVLMVEVYGVYLSVPYENTLYFFTGDGIGNANVTTLFDYLQNTFVAQMRPLLVNTFRFDGLRGTDLSAQDAPTYERVFTGGLAGTATGAGLPGGTAAVITFLTAARGRTARGRNYISGIAEDQVTGNGISTTWSTSLKTAYGKLLSANGLPASWVWGVLSRWQNKVQRSSGVFRPITQVTTTADQVGSQRRRNNRQ